MCWHAPGVRWEELSAFSLLFNKDLIWPCALLAGVSGRKDSRASVKKAHCHYPSVLLREKKALRKAYTVRQCFSGFHVDGRLKCRLWFNRSGVWLRFALGADSQEILQLLSANGDERVTLPQKSLEIINK